MAEPQPQRVQDKLAFLLALVPYLLENDGVAVAQAAVHFDLDEERVREAVRLIAVSGVPGDSRQYQHGDLFDIDWDAFLDDDRIVLTHQVAIDDSPRFSAREAAALIAALQYLSALPEDADRAALASLTAKLTRGASTPPSALAVDAGGIEPPALATVRRALANSAVLVFTYVNGRDEHEQRAVEPLRVESVDDSWYLRGWDRARTALRTFRLDRMSEVRIDAELAPERPDDVVLPERIFSPSKQDTTVVVDLPAAVVPLIADYLADRPVLEPSPDGAGRVRTRLRIAHLHGLKRLVTARGGLVRVVEPDEARAVVAEWAAAGAAQYDS